MKKIWFCTIMLLSILLGCKKHKIIDNYVGEYNFTFLWFKTENISGVKKAQAWKSNTTGSISKKKKTNIWLNINTNSTIEPFETKIYEQKKFRYETEIKDGDTTGYQRILITGNWEDCNHLNMEFIHSYPNGNELFAEVTGEKVTKSNRD